MSSKKPEMTPMMEQWWSLKQQAGDALLFFRLGDFYELFNEDAETAAPIMGVTLTARNQKSAKEKQPLCGVPIHHFENYLHKVLDAGYRVALAEQTETAGAGKKLVRREIVQWFSPGIRLLASSDRPAYCGVLTGDEKKWAFAAADVATGHLVIESGNSIENIIDLIKQLPVLDLRIPYREKFDLSVHHQRAVYLVSEKEAQSLIMNALSVSQWEDRPTRSTQETLALGTLIQVLKEAHPLQKIRFLRPQEFADCVWMNASTKKNLNLEEPKENNLLQFLDETKTSMGRRFLKQLLQHPSFSKEEIQSRQQLVHFFKNNDMARGQFRKNLQRVYDIDRMLRKKSTPTNLFQISESLQAGLAATNDLPQEHAHLQALQKAGLQLDELASSLSIALKHSDTSDSGWIAEGVSSDLDELRDFQRTANQKLSELELSLREKLQISNLKIKFHQVFGYVAEVTALHKSKIPDSVKHVQSLANSTRFKTPEIDSLEEKLLSINSRIREAESALLEKLYETLDQNLEALQNWSAQLAICDCFQALASVSRREDWVTPTTLLSKTQRLQLTEAKHPLSQEDFIPLNFELSQEATQVMLLSGPNMAGKSTVLRLAALFALLHQIGSDVPAKAAELSIFDRIMCRMGAFDDLTQGKSTFFIEMKEVSNMLHGASEKSLLLFDELGRGTSTYDGMSLAWAITEEVHELGSLSIVATHYLEMSKLEKSLSHLKNFHVGVKALDNRLIFTRKLEEGPASQSYGIQVAKLAEISPSILKRAEQKLKDFEKKPNSTRPLLELMRPQQREQHSIQ